MEKMNDRALPVEARSQNTSNESRADNSVEEKEFKSNSAFSNAQTFGKECLTNTDSRVVPVMRELELTNSS